MFYRGMWISDLFVLVLGLVSGSFLFTMAVRLYRQESIWRRSACDHCSSPVSILGLIPIFGYLILGGKCGSCREKISPIYPLAELLNTGLVYAIYLNTGWIYGFIHLFLIFETLILIGVLDFRSYLVFPQPIIFGLIIQTIWLIFAEQPEITSSLLGLFIGAGIFHWIAYLYQTLRKKVGLGEGDATLLGLIGFAFGWNYLLAIIFWGAIFGMVGGGLLLVVKRESWRKEIAFAPWLVIATFLVWYFPAFFGSVSFGTSYNLFIPK